MAQFNISSVIYYYHLLPRPCFEWLVTVGSCKSTLPYNHTSVSTSDQNEIHRQVDLVPLIGRAERCYPSSRLLLCSFFLPQCLSMAVVSPCRSACLGKYPIQGLWINKHPHKDIFLIAIGCPGLSVDNVPGTIQEKILLFTHS